ncbi:unnamed protein product [Pseudo-nitzschia multistriata]|uniref:Uncharacterized protein n=1 Tax=Pseudo-nitzschia multistriata TaxID=183589 RepID=A0A448ZBC6_9STRA|nr:unnamed protein product [Pseudo-nitzschia multistriata]
MKGDSDESSSSSSLPSMLTAVDHRRLNQRNHNIFLMAVFDNSDTAPHHTTNNVNKSHSDESSWSSSLSSTLPAESYRQFRRKDNIFQRTNGDTHHKNNIYSSESKKRVRERATVATKISVRSREQDDENDDSFSSVVTKQSASSATLQTFKHYYHPPDDSLLTQTLHFDDLNEDAFNNNRIGLDKGESYASLTNSGDMDVQTRVSSLPSSVVEKKSFYTSEELLDLFEPFCPNFSLPGKLDSNFNNSLSRTKMTSQLAGTLFQTLPFREIRNNKIKTVNITSSNSSKLIDEWIWGNNNDKMGYAAGVMSFWIFVSLGLTLWWLLLWHFVGREKNESNRSYANVEGLTSECDDFNGNPDAGDEKNTEDQIEEDFIAASTKNYNEFDNKKYSNTIDIFSPTETGIEEREDISDYLNSPTSLEVPRDARLKSNSKENQNGHQTGNKYEYSDDCAHCHDNEHETDFNKEDIAHAADMNITNIASSYQTTPGKSGASRNHPFGKAQRKRDGNNRSSNHNTEGDRMTIISDCDTPSSFGVSSTQTPSMTQRTFSAKKYFEIPEGTETVNSEDHQSIVDFDCSSKRKHQSFGYLAKGEDSENSVSAKDNNESAGIARTKKSLLPSFLGDVIFKSSYNRISSRDEEDGRSSEKEHKGGCPEPSNSLSSSSPLSFLNMQEQEVEHLLFQKIPIMPILSDLSMPPGLSESSVASSSLTNSDISLAVLASDDIYTGNHYAFTDTADKLNYRYTARNTTTSAKMNKEAPTAPTMPVSTGIRPVGKNAKAVNDSAVISSAYLSYCFDDDHQDCILKRESSDETCPSFASSPMKKAIFGSSSREIGVTKCGHRTRKQTERKLQYNKDDESSLIFPSLSSSSCPSPPPSDLSRRLRELSMKSSLSSVGRSSSLFSIPSPTTPITIAGSYLGDRNSLSESPSSQGYRRSPTLSPPDLGDFYNINQPKGFLNSTPVPNQLWLTRNWNESNSKKDNDSDGDRETSNSTNMWTEKSDTGVSHHTMEEISVRNGNYDCSVLSSQIYGSSVSEAPMPTQQSETANTLKRELRRQESMFRLFDYDDGNTTVDLVATTDDSRSSTSATFIHNAGLQTKPRASFESDCLARDFANTNNLSPNASITHHSMTCDILKKIKNASPSASFVSGVVGWSEDGRTANTKSQNKSEGKISSSSNPHGSTSSNRTNSNRRKSKRNNDVSRIFNREINPFEYDRKFMRANSREDKENSLRTNTNGNIHSRKRSFTLLRSPFTSLTPPKVNFNKRPSDQDLLNLSESSTGVGPFKSISVPMVSPSKCSMKLSSYSSNLLKRKRRLEAFAKSWKDSSNMSSKHYCYDPRARIKRLKDFINTADSEKSTDTASLYADSKIGARKGDSFETVQANYTNSCDTRRKTNSDIDNCSVLPPDNPFESVLSNPDHHSSIDCHANTVFQSIGVSLSSGSGKQLIHKIIFAGSCVFLIVSVALFAVLGFAELHKSMESLESQWEDLQLEAMIPAMTIDLNAMADKGITDDGNKQDDSEGDPIVTMSLTELDRKSQTMYVLLGDHCPKVRPALCSSNDLPFSFSPSSSMCHLHDLPLGKSWMEWLDAVNGDRSFPSPHLPSGEDTGGGGNKDNDIKMSKSNSTFSQQEKGRYNRFLRWLDRSRDEAAAFFSSQDDRIQDVLAAGTWILWLALFTNLGLAVVASAALVQLVGGARGAPWLLAPNIGSSSYCVCFPQTPNPDTKKVLFAIFWTLAVLSWIVGMCFSIAAVVSVDLCVIEEDVGGNSNNIYNSSTNSFAIELIDRWQSEEDYDRLFDDVDGRAEHTNISDEYGGNYNNDNDYKVLSIVDIWKLQLHRCAPTKGGQDANVNHNYSVPTQEVLEDLARLAGPSRTLADGLNTFSSSGIYENICGRGGGVAPLVDASEDMSLQVCIDAQAFAEIHLEWTPPPTCVRQENSSLKAFDAPRWISIYDNLLQNTVCRQGLWGLAWATCTQMLILVFVLVVWNFRFAVTSVAL